VARIAAYHARRAADDDEGPALKLAELAQVRRSCTPLAGSCVTSLSASLLAACICQSNPDLGQTWHSLLTSSNVLADRGEQGRGGARWPLRGGGGAARLGARPARRADRARGRGAADRARGHTRGRGGARRRWPLALSSCQLARALQIHGLQPSAHRLAMRWPCCLLQCCIHLPQFARGEVLASDVHERRRHLAPQSSVPVATTRRSSRRGPASPSRK
jgi:hypothetical protein